MPVAFEDEWEPPENQVALDETIEFAEWGKKFLEFLRTSPTAKESNEH